MPLLRQQGEPPLRGIWDQPIESVPLVFVDLEMTGVEEHRDRVLQLCLERVVGGTLVDVLTSYLDPECAIGNTHVHGIGPEEVRGAPVFAVLAPRIRELLDGAIFIAHGAKCDIAFLKAEFARCGVPWTPPFFIDTVPLSRRAYNFKSHRLSALAEELGIDCPAAHRADNDVRVLRGLFLKLTILLMPTSPRDLWNVRPGLAHARPLLVGELTEALATGAALRLRYRPAGRAIQEIPFHVTSLRTDLDPPMVIGYLSHTRGRRELRIDRILSLEPVVKPGSTS